MREHLTPEERLDILRQNDMRRKWYSLDDQRVCVLCDRVITGRQVEIRRTSRGATLHCPTEGCESTPDHWFYHPAACAPAGTVTRSGEFSFL